MVSVTRPFLAFLRDPTGARLDESRGGAVCNAQPIQKHQVAALLHPNSPRFCFKAVLTIHAPSMDVFLLLLMHSQYLFLANVAFLLEQIPNCRISPGPRHANSTHHMQGTGAQQPRLETQGQQT
jgi:hypothetical protein